MPRGNTVPDLVPKDDGADIATDRAVPHPAGSGERRALGTPLRMQELEGAPLLKDFPLQAAYDLLSSCPVRSLEPGETLIEAGGIGHEVFILLSGRCAVRVGALESEEVSVIEPGETMGELALVDNGSRSAYVVATEPSRALVLSPMVFWSLIYSSHEIAVNLLTILATRLRGNNETITEGRRLAKLYQRHASVDALTGLHNRRWLDEILPRQTRRSAMQHEPVSVLMIDIDHFKRFNDEFGHAAGDFVLFAVAQVLKERLRPTDLIARYGGEELTALLPRTDLSGAKVAAERLRRAVAFTPLVMPDGVALPELTVSIGCAELHAGDEPNDLLARADTALYRAKRLGRNRVET